MCTVGDEVIEREFKYHWWFRVLSRQWSRQWIFTFHTYIYFRKVSIKDEYCVEYVWKIQVEMQADCEYPGNDGIFTHFIMNHIFSNIEFVRPYPSLDAFDFSQFIILCHHHVLTTDNIHHSIKSQFHHVLCWGIKKLPVQRRQRIVFMLWNPELVSNCCRISLLWSFFKSCVLLSSWCVCEQCLGCILMVCVFFTSGYMSQTFLVVHFEGQGYACHMVQTAS